MQLRSRVHVPSMVTSNNEPGGEPLPADLRELLEWSYRADLSAVRVHAGAAADHACRLLGADAFATGREIYFRAACRMDTVSGRWLAAHETAHLVQQACSHRSSAARAGWLLSAPDDADEQQADEWAGRAMTGMRARTTGPRLTVSTGRSGIIQRHVSFEHRYLGDGPTRDLMAISARDPGYLDILSRQIQLLDLWQTHPEKVTEKQITALCPWIRTVRLKEGLLATYGELNALPDYLADHQALDELSPQIVLPILQVIRQEGFNKLTVLKGEPDPNRTFAGAATSPWSLSLVNNIVETSALDEFTFGLGPKGEDHYQGLLARNACHFAPFSWYRWQASHVIARDLARRAHDTHDADLARQAWIANGYADHFLQDSFAAGHLVNKTLVMQWFIEWAANQALLPVADWDAIKDMTTAKQPGIGGLALYDPHYTGASCDPQTAQEAATLVERITASAVAGKDAPERLAAYRNYLTFLTSAVTQLSSANIHDYYNEHSLWVASAARPKAFEIWGDDTLLTGANGVEGVQHTSETTLLSQRALREIIETGSTQITTQMIRDEFPSKAGASGTSLKNLQDWAQDQRKFCEDTIFSDFIPRLKQLAIILGSPRMGIVSQDQEFASVWGRSLPQGGYGRVELLPSPGRLFAGANGSVYELDPQSGKVLWSLQVSGTIGDDDYTDYTTRLALKGTILFAGVHGYIYAVDVDARKALWNVGLGDKGYHPVAARVHAESLFAGCNGYVYELDPAKGAILHKLLVAGSIGAGDYETRIEVTDDMLFAGTHGYVYGVNRADWSRSAWYLGVGGSFTFNLPNLLLAEKRLFAGCNGYVYEINPAAGTLAHMLSLSKIGVGDYETRLAYEGGKLFAGAHGYLYGINANSNWSAPIWQLPLDGLTYNPVSVVAANGRVFAGSNGSVYEVDPAGTFRHKLLLTYLFGIGNYDVSMAPVGLTLFAGVHGYAYAVSLNESAG